jgi:hypothetical protein
MANRSIINIIDGIPVMENSLGCKLVPSFNDQKWGLGTLYLNGKQLGDTITYFLKEESVNKCFCASNYEVVENNENIGIIKFSGKDGKLDFDVKITLKNDKYAYLVEFNIDPIHPIYHSVYSVIPFYSDKMLFAKYPYEDTLTADHNDKWVVETDQGRVPFFFGCENIDGGEYYVGVGYSLKDNFNNGRFEFDRISYPNSPFKIYSLFKGMARAVDLQCVTKLELLRVDLEEEYKKSQHIFRYVISTSTTQYDCVESYASMGEYDRTVKIRHSIEHAVDRLMTLYKTTPGYVNGKGYHQLIRVDTGDFDTTVPHGWYSKYLVTGPQLQLAQELYRYWTKNKNDYWAKARAFEMADFLLTIQEDNGSFPNWDTDMGGTGMMHPDNVEGTAFNDYVYGISDMSIGAYHLYMLYDEVKEQEGIDRQDWKTAAQKSIRFIVEQIKPEGALGRNYNERGEYDKIGTALSAALLAMDYMYTDTGDEVLNESRLKVEKWLYDNFLKVNNWSNGCMDGGAWQGADWPPPHNNDSLGIITFACYCAQMHLKYNDNRYIQMAKDVFAYQWLVVVPTEIPGFKHGTRGLMREQDFYSAFDLPMKIDDYAECLPYLSKITGDPFFMEYFRIILQNQMDYQETEKQYGGFHIGLECDYNGRDPIDRVAERNSCYIVRFASLFIKTVNSPIAYQYVGGSGWGLGRDYNLAFNPDMGEGIPYVLCSSAMIRDVEWNNSDKTMRIFAYDRKSEHASIEIKWNSKMYPIENTFVEMNDMEIAAKQLYDVQNDIINVVCSSDAPSKVVRVIYK